MNPITRNFPWEETSSDVVDLIVNDLYQTKDWQAICHLRLTCKKLKELVDNCNFWNSALSNFLGLPGLRIKQELAREHLFTILTRKLPCITQDFFQTSDRPIALMLEAGPACKVVTNKGFLYSGNAQGHQTTVFLEENQSLQPALFLENGTSIICNRQDQQLIERIQFSEGDVDRQRLNIDFQPEDILTNIASFPDYKKFFLTFSTGRFLIFDLGRNSVRSDLLLTEDTTISSVAIRDDFSELYGRSDGTLTLKQDLSIYSWPRHHIGEISAVCFSSDKTAAFSVDWTQGQIKMVNLTSHQTLFTLTGDPEITTLKQQGALLFSFSLEQQISIWNYKHQTQLYHIQDPAGMIICSFEPSAILYGTNDLSIKLLSLLPPENAIEPKA